MKRLRLKPGVVEGQTITEDSVQIDVDVCIVGSGAGGSVAAATLAQKGYQVLVLEEGGYFTSERFRMLESECYPHLYQESAQRTTEDLSVSIFQGKAVGGGTVINWTTCFRLPESTLDLWKRRFMVDELTMEPLKQHFTAVEDRLGIHKTSLELANKNNRLLWDGCKSLGYQVDTLYRNVRLCSQTGYCGMGCPVMAKQSMLMTYIPDAIANGATILSRCRVEGLVSQGGKIVELRGVLLDAMGIEERSMQSVRREVRVHAKKYILSAGAIGSPAILIRSGLPDPHSRVGRRTFLHPTIVSAGMHRDPVHAYHGAPQSVSSHNFAHRGDNVGYFLEAAPVYPMLLTTSLPGWGPSHKKLASKLPYFSGHIALAIDGHHEGEEGGQVKVLQSGSPKLSYQPTAKILDAFCEAQKTLAKIQLEAGADAVYTLHAPTKVIRSEKDLRKIDRASFASNRMAIFSAHQMGGCAMSDDKKIGVVRSADLRHHHMENLHIIDGSVFPTALGVNPQHSIYGIAHWASERLAALWR